MTVYSSMVRVWHMTEVCLFEQFLSCFCLGINLSAVTFNFAGFDQKLSNWDKSPAFVKRSLGREFSKKVNVIFASVERHLYV